MRDAGSETVASLDIGALVGSCLQMELQQGLAARSVGELKRYLGDFAGYCTKGNVNRAAELNAEFILKYVQWRYCEAGPTLWKAIVWSLAPCPEAKKTIIVSVHGRLPPLHGSASTRTPSIGHSTRRGRQNRYSAIPHKGTWRQDLCGR